MKKFVYCVLCFVMIPVSVLFVVYCVTDPYKTIRPFSLSYFDCTNRDYLSSELFLQNYSSQHYDSYIFASSRGCGINTYHWLKYLPEGSRQFLFQAWAETLTGMEEKIEYIDEHGCQLSNVILMLDYPGTFCEEQHPTKTLSIKHPAFSGQPLWQFQMILFYNFVQKPSQWSKAIKTWISKDEPYVSFDPVSNDWDMENKYRDLTVPPKPDSLANCSAKTRRIFLWENAHKTDADIPSSEAVINDEFEAQLRNVKRIFEKHNTSYRIVIAPGYCYTSPVVNDTDIKVLNDIFGKEFVYDYTGKNFLTSDYNNYSDPIHFGLRVGWYMIEDMYGDNHIAREK